MKFAAVFTLTTTNLTLIGYYPHYVNSSPLNWKQYRFVSEETKQKHVRKLNSATLSRGNVDGDGNAKTCEKIGERTPLYNL